jgi:hypothetical protein
MLEGRTTVKYISKNQDDATANYRVKLDNEDASQGYLYEKLGVAGDLTITDTQDATTGIRKATISGIMPVSQALVSGGVLTNNGVGTAWTDVITFENGNANIKQGSQIASATTLTANAQKIDLQAGGVSQMDITADRIDVKKYLYYTGGGTVSSQRPLMINPNNQVVPYGYSNFYRIDSIDSTSYVVAGRNNLTNSIQIYANKGALITAENAINLDSNTGTYTLADVPTGSGVPLVLSTATGQIYYNDSRTLYRAALTLTRSQILALSTTLVSLVSAPGANRAILPKALVHRGGATRLYNGYGGLCYSTGGSTNGCVALDFGYIKATPKYMLPTQLGFDSFDISNAGIYVYGNITDGGTSDAVQLWFEYSIIDL